MNQMVPWPVSRDELVLPTIGVCERHNNILGRETSFICHQEFANMHVAVSFNAHTPISFLFQHQSANICLSCEGRLTSCIPQMELTQQRIPSRKGSRCMKQKLGSDRATLCDIMDTNTRIQEYLEKTVFVFFWELFRFRNERNIISFILLPIAE